MTWRQGRFRINKQKWALEKGVWQPVVREEHVLKEIVFRLWHAAKIRLWRINCPVGGKVKPNEAGIPDLIGYIPTRSVGSGAPGEACRPLFIEVKRPGGARRAAQERFIADARAAGCLAFFAESWSDVVREFGDGGIKLPN